MAKELTAIINLAGKVDKSLDAAFASVNATAKGLNKTIAESPQSEFQKKLSTTGSHLIQVGDKVTNLGKRCAAMSAVAGAAFVDVATKAASFNKSMNKVATIADTSQVSMGNLKKGVLDISSATGKSAADISDALYQSLSASVKTADALQFTRDAAKLAGAGFLSTADSVDVLTTVINAYGMKAQDASRISDVLIQTQNDGKTTVQQLAASMGQVIPTAAAYGVSLTNLSTAYAIMTKKGINAAESTTGIKAMINELGKSGSNVAGILKQKTGKSFGELMKSGKSLGDIMGILKDSVNGDSEAFANLWSNARAKSAALALQDTKTFNTELQKMGSSAGNTDAALQKMHEGAAYNLQRLQTAFKNLKIALGESFDKQLGTVFGHLADALCGLQKMVENMPDFVKNGIMRMLVTLALVSPVLVIVGKTISSIGTAMQGLSTAITVFKGIKTAITTAKTAMTGFKGIFTLLQGGMTGFFGLMSGKLLLIIGIIAAVGVAIYELVKHWDSVKKIAASVGNFVVGVWNHIKQVTLTVWHAIGSFLSTIWNGIKTVATTLWNAIKFAVTHPIQAAKYVLTTTWTTIKSAAIRIWSAMRATASAIWNAIKNAMITPIRAAKAVLVNLVNGIKNAFIKAFNKIKGAIQGVIDKVKKLISWLGNLGKKHVSPSVNLKQSGGGGGKKNGKAKGGFTNGVTIAGEDKRYPVEAVISFNPAYRDANIKYWEQAGEMLGMRYSSIQASTLPKVEQTAKKQTTTTTAKTGQIAKAQKSISSAAKSMAQNTARPITPNTTISTYDTRVNPSNSVNVGGVTFAPQISVNGATNPEETRESVLKQLRELEPEFVDFVMDAIKREAEGVYTSGSVY